MSSQREKVPGFHPGVNWARNRTFYKFRRPKNENFTKINEFKTDSSQKSETLKRTLKLKIIRKIHKKK